MERGAAGEGRRRVTEFVGWAPRSPKSARVGKIVHARCPRGGSRADDFAHPTGYWLGWATCQWEKKMRLRDFIAEALMEVQHGVLDAIERRDKSGIPGRISPAFSDLSDTLIDWTKLLEKVEFDVAVTESSTKEAAGGGSLEIVSIGKLGAKGSTTLEHSAVNRIRFSVPVLLPVQVVAREGRLSIPKADPAVRDRSVGQGNG